MKILVTGKSGQLARSLVERASRYPQIELIAVGRPKLDLAVPGSAEKLILERRPDLVINTAAETDVDGAEEHRLHAMRINAEGAGEVASAAAAIDAPVVQISTDYVFDGEDSRPYAEDAPTQPLNAYGRSKLAGEEAVRSANSNHLILRTAWVYSPFGRNFVKTMFEAAEERDELRLITDKRGSPTSALDLADALLAIVSAWRGGKEPGRGQIYHLVGSGEATWYEWAEQVMQDRRQLGLRTAKLVPILAREWPMRAVRPTNSVLDSRKFQHDFQFHMPDWRKSLSEVVRRLAAKR